MTLPSMGNASSTRPSSTTRGRWRCRTTRYGAQTYLPWHSLVKWYYNGDSWSFDFTHFDRYVKESRAAGVGPQISAFGLVGFQGNNHLVYTDTRTDKPKDQRVTLGGSTWTSAWTAFLRAFQAHLQRRGWLQQTHIAFDERPASEMQTALDLVKRAAPALAHQKFAIAGDQDAHSFASDLSMTYDDVDSWSQKIIKHRRQAGKLTTFYTWNRPQHPNTLTMSPPIGARLLPWISAQHNLDGYLRWTYNSWPADPFTDPSFMAKKFPTKPPYRPGDEYLVYPGKDGPISSIRWELFYDGEQDFILLNELARRAGRANSTLKKAMAAVDPSTTPAPRFYRKFLQARSSVIRALEHLDRPR